jgi:hypothetical protein
MNDTVWELPVPASALVRGPFFAALPKRQCEISFYLEGDDGEQKAGLLFEEVEAYKCTYMTSRSVDMINIAYGKLVRLGATSWLSEVVEISQTYYKQAQKPPRALQHLMICFDDGPCWEIICVNFKRLPAD